MCNLLLIILFMVGQHFCVLPAHTPIDDPTTLNDKMCNPNSKTEEEYEQNDENTTTKMKASLKNMRTGKRSIADKVLKYSALSALGAGSLIGLPIIISRLRNSSTATPSNNPNPEPRPKRQPKNLSNNGITFNPQGERYHLNLTFLNLNIDNLNKDEDLKVKLKQKETSSTPTFNVINLTSEIDDMETFLKNNLIPNSRIAIQSWNDSPRSSSGDRIYTWTNYKSESAIPISVNLTIPDDIKRYIKTDQRPSPQNLANFISRVAQIYACTLYAACLLDIEKIIITPCNISVGKNTAGEDVSFAKGPAGCDIICQALQHEIFTTAFKLTKCDVFLLIDRTSYLWVPHFSNYRVNQLMENELKCNGSKLSISSTSFGRQFASLKHADGTESLKEDFEPEFFSKFIDPSI